MAAFHSEFFNSNYKFRQQTEHTTASVTKSKINTHNLKNSQHKPSENSYLQQCKQLQNILESTSDRVLAVDFNWNVTYANTAQASIFGYTPNQMIGKNVWQLLPNLIGTEIEKNFFEAMQKRESKCYEIKGIYQKGFFEQRIFPSLNGITVYTKDVTEHKEAEIELIQKTIAIDQAHNAIFIADPNFRLLTWNKGAEKLYGYRAQEVLGRDTDFLQTYYVGQEKEEVLRQIIEQGEWNGEGVQKRKDGSEIHTSISVTKIRDGGNVLGYTAVMRDITQLKQTEEELKKSRQRIHDIIESISDDFFSLDKDWNFVYINKYAANNWGYEPAQLSGKNIWEVLPRFIGTDMEKNLRESMQNREVKRFEWKALYSPGIRDVTVFPSVEGVTIYAKDITKRKKAEEALRESEQRFAKSFHSSPAALFISRLSDGLLVDVNESFLKILEYRYEDVVGHTAPELNIYLDPSKRAELARILKTRRTMRDFEIIVRTKTGRHVTVMASIDIICLNKEDYIMGTFLDITERKKTEEALKQSEERFRFVAEAANVLVYESAFDNDRIIIVRGLEELLGYKNDQQYSTYQWWSNIIHPQDRQRINENLKVTMENKNSKGYILEYRIRHKNGQYLIVKDTAKIIRDKSGKSTRVIGGIRDITERKKAEESILKSEERLKLAQRIAHVGNWEFYIKENKAIWSEELFRIFGLEPQEFGPNIEEYTKLIFPADVELIRNTMQNFNVNGHIGDKVSFDYRIVLSDGSIRVIHSQRMIAEVDELDKPLRIIGIEQDITERKRIEQQLEEYSKHLEKLVEERTNQLKDAERLATIGQVAGMVGHDIRNPLQAIISELYFARQSIDRAPNGDFKQGALESVAIIQEQADYISKIVSDLQDYARPLKPDIKEVDLSDLIASTFLAVNVPNRITLTVNIEGFPKLKTDPTFVRRAITNLANNAIQAMPEQGKLIITVAQKEKQIAIIIEDTGKGIPEEVKPKLFTPLFTTKSKGQGFGLAVTKRLIEALGGTLDFESQTGKGTKFTIYLPL